MKRKKKKEAEFSLQLQAIKTHFLEWKIEACSF